MALVVDVFDGLTSLSQINVLLVMNRGYDRVNDIAPRAGVSDKNLLRGGKLMSVLIDLELVEFSFVDNPQGGKKGVSFSLTQKGERFVNKIVEVFVHEI